MKIPIEFYELLRSRINLSDLVKQKVTLTRKSGEYIGLCPFHQEKSPSFTVSDKKRFYHCFGCGAHGDAIRFTSNISGLSYKESAIKLAGDYGIELPRLTKEEERAYEESDQIFNILVLAAEFFKSELTTEAKNYLNKRSISQKLIEEFDIGFAPSGGRLQKFFEKKSIPLLDLIRAGLVGKREDGRIYEIFHDRIIFPIKNIYNKTIGFGGRVIGDGLPKYLNSPETIVFKKNDTLYGEDKAISTIYKKNYAILVEGYLDVIALHKANFCETIASLGTAVTEGHVQKLWRACDEIILCLDGDNAGMRASAKVINLVLQLVTHDKKISFILLPNGNDPDDIITKNGSKFFQGLIDKRISLSEMIWHVEYSGKNYANAESKAGLEANLANYCNQIKDHALKLSYRRFFKDQVWQNLIKHQKISKNINSYTTNSINHEHYTEIEILEHGFCSVLVAFPEILKEEKVKGFCLAMNFKNKELSDFRDWVFTEFNLESGLQAETIKEAAKNTRFYELVLVLLKPNNLFLDTLFNKDTNYWLFWELLHKKYHLVLLKQEYGSIVQSGSFERVALYQKEIVRTFEELQKLNELFINN